MSDSHTQALTDLAIRTLDDMKALDVKIINVESKSTITDVLIVTTGKSTTHVKAIADAIALNAKKEGYQPIGMEGENAREWILVDLNDVVVHVMLQKVRDFYNLEKLWELDEQDELKSGTQS